MLILQLCYWKFSHKQTIHNWNWILFWKKNKKSLFELPFRELMGNVRTPSIARWKARGRLYIRHSWTFFTISYGWDVTSGWDVISGNLSKMAFFEGGRSLWAQISDRKGRRPLVTVGVRKLEWAPFSVVSKYPQCIVWFCHKACVTDGRMDGVTTPKTALA